ncbi:uncharacterized protein LOC131038820 [Cryptomeria japonica]|uniref:uncharacterized protein LOC131038820 n=1 Tax=Cryptomeria japonica TaxID=3369 RepID=UPI0025AC7A4B|nr:uncharacterized protein LOC131038820 [Cryptomeria japonica]
MAITEQYEDKEALSLKEMFEKLEATSMAHTHPLTTPIQSCFRWDSLFTLPPFTKQNMKLYGVAFRSVRKSDCVDDDSLLYAADASAYQEVLTSGKLIGYWYGTLNERRECLASCIWRNREAAESVMSAPLHIKAASLATHFYERYTLESFWIHCNSDGSYTIEIIRSTSSSFS